MDVYTNTTEELNTTWNNNTLIVITYPFLESTAFYTEFELTTREEENFTVYKTNEPSSVHHHHSEFWAVYNLPSITFLALNLVIGLVGNTMVTYIYGFCLKGSPMNSFVVSLSIIDIITSVVAMPLMILHDLLPNFFISDTTCKILHFAYSSTLIASSLILVTIAIDRYCRICRPLSKHLSVVQVKLVSIILVTASALTCTPIIEMAGSQEQRSHFADFEHKYCYLKRIYINSVYSEVFYSYKSAVILLTIIITTSCYFRIWFESKESVSGDQQQQGFRRMSVRSMSVQPKIRPNVKKMFMITLLFIFSFLPSICVILVMMSMNVRDENLHPVAISFVNICRRTYLVSASFNPFICWYCNATFRLRVKDLISSWLPSDHSSNSISEPTSL